MVAEICHHLSDNSVDLLDLDVDLSNNYVDLKDANVDFSDPYVDLSENITSTGGTN